MRCTAVGWMAARLGKQSRASRSVHREIDAAAAFERLVRRVDDRIGGASVTEPAARLVARAMLAVGNS